MLAAAAPAPAPTPAERPGLQAPPWTRAGLRVTGSLAAVALAVLVVADLAPGSGSSPESAVSMAAPAGDSAAAGGAAPATSPALAPQATAAAAGPPVFNAGSHDDSGSSNSGQEATPARDEQSSTGAPAPDATARKAPAAASDGPAISALRLAQAAAAIVAIVALAASFLVPASQRKGHP